MTPAQKYVLFVLTLFGHVQLLVAVMDTADGLSPLAACCVGLLFWACTWQLRRLYDDRYGASAFLVLLEELRYVHWCASLVSLGLLLPAFAINYWLRGQDWHIRGGVVGACRMSYLLALLLAVWGAVRRRLIRTRHFRLPIEGRSLGLIGYRVLHLSDLHIGRHISPRLRKKWGAAVVAAQADLILVTGDLVSAGVDYYADAAGFLGSLPSKDGVVVTLGNHDLWDPGLLREQLEAQGVSVLDDELLEVGPGILLAGLTHAESAQARLQSLLEQTGHQEATLLLCHYPSCFADKPSSWLTLSGHTHGGQFAVPWMPHLNLAAWVEHYSAGWYQRGRRHLFVNSGLGTTGPPLRLGVPPELALLTFVP